jgi:hypothetical protein
MVFAECGAGVSPARFFLWKTEQREGIAILMVTKGKAFAATKNDL